MEHSQLPDKRDEINDPSTSSSSLQVWLVYGLVILLCAGLEIAFYYKPPTRAADDFTPLPGALGGIIIFFCGQKILDSNLFKGVAITCLMVLLLNVYKWSLISPDKPLFNHFSEFAFLIPIVYLAYFRIVTMILFPEYPNMKVTPVIPYYGRGGTDWKGKDDGYVPTPKEEKFSRYLFFGIWGIFFLIMYLAPPAHESIFSR